MPELYETIRKSVFAYFCKHHGRIFNEEFAKPSKSKITKLRHKYKARKHYNKNRASYLHTIKSRTLDSTQANSFVKFRSQITDCASIIAESN